ncbi:hypothetical protein HK097_011032 [Rhizophlyctis rosea]|uniref:Uncharacterized protein n=1 Tax=Rhizophlyctis rosea TaxID=64517 RepID=A0AAD5S6W4_9FUNG|nr:hypothetical protein HK097_011032 [Rhizophlyctis rosea]
MAETDLQKLESQVLQSPDPAANAHELSAHLRAISSYIPSMAVQMDDSEEESEEESEEGNILSFLKIVGPGCSAIVDTVASMEEDERTETDDRDGEIGTQVLVEAESRLLLNELSVDVSVYQ